MSADISEIPASAESIFGWDELNIEQELFDDIPSSLFEPEDIDLPSEMPEVENVPSSSTASPVQSQSTKKRKDKKKKTSKELDIDNSVAQSEIDVCKQFPLYDPLFVVIKRILFLKIRSFASLQKVQVMLKLNVNRRLRCMIVTFRFTFSFF